MFSKTFFVMEVEFYIETHLQCIFGRFTLITWLAAAPSFMQVAIFQQKACENLMSVQKITEI